MLSTLYVTKDVHVTPLFDIRYQDVATAYSEGLKKHLHNRHKLIPVSHLVTCLQRAISVSTFNGQHQAAAHDFVGYHFGSIHGTIVTADGKYSHNTVALAALDSSDAKRGYLAGRHWFFYEASPLERRLSDDYLIDQLHEIVSDSTAWHDSDQVWHYAIASLLGELSGPVFSATQEEQTYWEAQDQEVIAWMAKQQAQLEVELSSSLPVVMYTV